MEEGYVVRAMVYQGSDGKFTRHLGQAQLIKDKDLAEAAANLGTMGKRLKILRVINRKKLKTS